MNRFKQTYFEIWGSEQAQNALLKMLLLGLAMLFLFQSIVLCILDLRKPVLIAIGAQKTGVLKITPPSSELLAGELQRAVSHYVMSRYNWDAATIQKAHEEAQKYVSERFKQAFMDANAEQIRAVREKNLKEVAYISQIQVDPKTLIARVAMDRILIVPGTTGLVRATNPWNLEVHFEYGPRTEENPEGIYVTSDQLISPISNSK